MSLKVEKAALITSIQDLGRRGFQRFGMPVSGPMDWWDARERAHGWQDAMDEAGLTESDLAPDQSLIVYGSWEAASGEKGLNQLLDRRPDVEAVFVGNDQMALGALQTARKRGLRIPEDLTIVGFDGIPEAAYFWPPLTTVSQPLYDVGCTSVAELTRMIEVGRQGNTAVEPKTTMLQPELIVRESSVKDKSTGGS